MSVGAATNAAARQTVGKIVDMIRCLRPSRTRSVRCLGKLLQNIYNVTAVTLDLPVMVVKAWLLLTYKVPPEPAKKRIALWRKIKGLGAVYLQNGICVLPKTDDHVRRLKMIENEIAKLEKPPIVRKSS